MYGMWPHEWWDHRWEGEMIINSFTNEYDFLSNFYPCVVNYMGQSFPSVEHGYQALKTLEFDQRKLFEFGSPGRAKKLGQTLKLRPDWETQKVGVMRMLLLQKFHNPYLEQMLLDTGEAELIEGNWWGDRYWGMCNGEGQNKLGKMLMEERKVIRIEKGME